MSGSQIILVFDIMNMLEMTEVHIRVLVVAIVVLKLNSASTNVSSAIVLVVAIVVLKPFKKALIIPSTSGFSCSHSGIETSVGCSRTSFEQGFSCNHRY
jgi:hypothetical protein